MFLLFVRAVPFFPLVLPAAPVCLLRVRQEALLAAKVVPSTPRASTYGVSQQVLDSGTSSVTRCNVSFVRVCGAVLPSCAFCRCCLFAALLSGGAASGLFCSFFRLGLWRRLGPKSPAVQ